MSRFNQPKTFENYFVFFENKSKSMTRIFKWVLIAGISVNLLLIVLLHSGIIPGPQPKAGPRSTPAPEPVHFLPPPRVATLQ